MERLTTNTLDEDSFDAADKKTTLFEKILEDAKKTDNISCMNYVGKQYLYGLGDVPKNEKQGLEWLNKSIQKNNPAALLIVGKYYIEKALGIYEKEKDTESFSCLASIYEHGVGVHRNYERAMYWYKKLEEKDGCDGPYEAYYHLGRMYERGLGVEKDLHKALDYYKKCVPFNDKTEISLERSIERIEKELDK